MKPEASNRTSVDDIWDRIPRDQSVLIADGQGISLTVSYGHLIVRDGLGPRRRLRRLTRAQRTVKRITLLGRSGFITLDAIRWCHDTGISVIQLDPDGEDLLTAGAEGADNARLRRAQARADLIGADRDLAAELITHKVEGQAALLNKHFQAEQVGDTLQQIRHQLSTADLGRIRELEAKAASYYFATWTREVQIPFIERDAARIPDHWRTFTGRSSMLDYGRSPRRAADPINAVLNYAYALAEADLKLAIATVGLDPGMGVLHVDTKNRASLALDLIEPLRPVIDDAVLELLSRRRLRADELHETRQGACRLLPPLTHELAELAVAWQPLAGRWAERAAHLFADSSTLPIPLTTPLTGAKAKSAQIKTSTRRPRRDAKAAAPVPRTCRVCGHALTGSQRQLCASCLPVTRNKIATERVKAANASLAAMRASGTDPTNSPIAATKRSASLSARKQEELAWQADGDSAVWTRERYEREILPALVAVPLSSIRQATGLSISACSRIRSGDLTPHRRHWKPLMTIVSPQNRIIGGVECQVRVA